MTQDRFIYLTKFEGFQNNYPGPIKQSIGFDFKKHDYHIVFNAIMHGDEYGSLPAFIKAIEDLINQKLKYGGKVTFTLGNVDAFKKNVRFIEEDLNRAFHSFDNSTIERRRAKQIASIIKKANFFCDFHQTIGPTKDAFLMYKDRPKNYPFVNSVDVAPYAIFSSPDNNVTSGKKPAIEYAEQNGIPALVIELSQKGINQISFEKTYKAIKNILSVAEKVEKNSISLESSMLEEYKPKILNIVHRETFDDKKKCLHPGLVNLQEIIKGENLGLNMDGSPLTANNDGYLLFPKYPKRDDKGAAIGPLPTEIFLIAQ